MIHTKQYCFCHTTLKQDLTAPWRGRRYFVDLTPRAELDVKLMKATPAAAQSNYCM